MNDDGLDNAVSEDAGSSTLSLTLPPIGDCVYVNLCDSQSAMVQPGRPAKSNLKFGGANKTNRPGPPRPTNANRGSAAAAKMNRRLLFPPGQAPQARRSADDDLDNAVSEDAKSSTPSLTLPPIGDVCAWISVACRA